MNRSQLRAITQYKTNKNYLRISQESSRSSTITAKMESRDPNTGKIVATTESGGKIQAKFISNSSLKTGTIIPQIQGNFQTNYADAKPAAT